MEAARQFGGKLYDTVFSGEVRTCFRRALDEADRQDQGLRLRVRFDDALDMADLPWEYLYSSGLGRFLVLSTQTPLVRYIDLPDPHPSARSCSTAADSGHGLESDRLPEPRRRE